MALIDNEGIANKKVSQNIYERPFIRIAHGESPERPPLVANLKTFTKEELQKAWRPFGLSEQRVQNLCNMNVDFMIWENGLWIQYHQHNKAAFPNHVDYYPQWVTEAYSNLTHEVLKDIFSLCHTSAKSIGVCV